MTNDRTNVGWLRSALRALGCGPGMNLTGLIHSLPLNRPLGEASALDHTTMALARRSGLMVALPLGLLLLPCALAGCKTHSISQFVSPQVAGRVVDLHSHQTIRNVRVRRIIDDESRLPLDPPKGGQHLQQAPAVRTCADGTFVLNSVRALTPFRNTGWNSVSLAFEHPGYKRFSTNYTLANATNTVKGEPVVNTGDIRLIPLVK